MNLLQTFSLKRSSQKTFLIPEFVIDTINEKLDLNSGSNRACNFKSALRLRFTLTITP